MSAHAATRRTRVARVSVACQTDALMIAERGNSLQSSMAECVNLGSSGTVNGVPPASNNCQTNGAASTKEGSTRSRSRTDGEGTLILHIPNFSKMGDTMCSDIKKIRGVPWRIMVMPKQHMVQKKSQKCMGFFLQCCPDVAYSDTWSCKADAEMRLVAHKAGTTNFIRKTSHTYTAKENDWGYSCFMTWADVLDENQGYIEKDKVTLEITVRADYPKNMMSKEEFCKSIDQWYNLAEMQMSRGLVDLSIEANAQALKFCKDKDAEMREKLEKQKERLVKKKVLDSINRIENKTDSPKPVENTKPTSLRQALTGAQKTIAAKGGAKQMAKKDKRATMQQLKKKKQDLAIKEKELKRRNAADSDVTDENKLTNNCEHRKLSASDVQKLEAKVGTSKDSSTSTASNMTESVRYIHHAHSPGTRTVLRHRTITCHHVNGKCQAVQCCRDFCKSLVVQEDVTKVEVQIAHEQKSDSGRKSDDGDSTTACAGDDCISDNSDDYREDSSIHGGMCDQCATGHCDSLSSLEESMGAISLTENSCQTEECLFTPLPNPRRERRYAGTNGQQQGQLDPFFKNVISEKMGKILEATDEVSGQIYATPDIKAKELEQQRLCKFFHECFGFSSAEFAKEITKSLAVIGIEGLDNKQITTLQAQLFSRFDHLVDDHGTCCLAAGMCVVHARRVIETANEFTKVVNCMINEESPEYQQNGVVVVNPTKLGNSSNGLTNIHGRKLATAVRRHNTNSNNSVPSDFVITNDGTASGNSYSVGLNYSQEEEDEDSLHSSNETINMFYPKNGSFIKNPEDMLDLTEDSCIKSIRALLDDIGPYHTEISNRIQEQLKSNEVTTALPQLLNQLFSYSQALARSGDNLDTLLEDLRKKQIFLQKTNAASFREALKHSQKKIEEFDERTKRLEKEMNKKDELIKKLQAQVNSEESKFKTEHDRAEQLHVQLRDVRNQLKKTEKKAKQEETRNTSLLSEKLDTDEKMKALKKEIESLKKKQTEEKSKAKKEKDRDAEIIRRYEAEAVEKEAERDRERSTYEEKLTASKNKENKMEKEKKSLSASINSLTERAKQAELAQIDLALSHAVATIQKVKEDAHAGYCELEESIKKARPAGDAIRKNLTEWKTCEDECDRLIASTKSEFEAIREAVSKGTKMLTPADLKMPSPPALPKSIKLPPVQVVQPSTTTQPIAPPNIPPPPPAGVIGQPRTPSAINRYPSVPNRELQASPSTSNHPSSSLLGQAASPPGMFQMKMQAPSSRSEEASSPWSWSTPIANLSDMIRPVSEPQHPGVNHEMWNQADAQQQIRSMPFHPLQHIPPSPHSMPNAGHPMQHPAAVAQQQQNNTWINSPSNNWRGNRAPGMSYYDS